MADRGNPSENQKPRRQPPARGLVEYLSHLNGAVQLLIVTIGSVIAVVSSMAIADTGGVESLTSWFSDDESRGQASTPVSNTSTTLPVHTPSSAVTRSPSPTTETPAPTATTSASTGSRVSEAGGVVMDVLPSETTEPGQGLLSLSFSGTDFTIDDLYVSVYTSKLDARQEPAAGERIERDRTDSGIVVFNLPPGEYVVLADLPGYDWGTLKTDEGMANVIVQEGYVTSLSVHLGRLTVTTESVDRSIDDQYVAVYTQTADVNGNMVPDDRVEVGRTDNTGSISFDLTHGEYVVVSEFQGYNWGNATGVQGEAGVAVTAGDETVVEVSLGQILAEVRDTDGNAAEDVLLTVYTQVTDASGGPVPGDRVDRGRTANTGSWSIDVTPGLYCIGIGDDATCDVEVKAGLVTEVELTKP